MKEFVKYLHESTYKNNKILQDRQLVRVLTDEDIIKIRDQTKWLEDQDINDIPRSLTSRIHLILNNKTEDSIQNGICGHDHCDGQTLWKNQQKGF